jgi:hypothetical protein
LEEEVAGKSTRITVDLGSEELVKSLKISAIEQRRTVRDIVVEALAMWLATARPASSERGGTPTTGSASSSDKDYRNMIETLNRYRGVGGK